MEFDKSKILTVVTADQAKVGSMGHFSNYIPTLEGYVTRGCKPDKLMRVSLNTIYPFFDGHNYYSLFYPAPEPTYRPYNSEELNYIVGNVLARKCDGSNISVNERINAIKVRLGDGCTYTAEQPLELFTHNGQPCGMREET